MSLNHMRVLLSLYNEGPNAEASAAAARPYFFTFTLNRSRRLRSGLVVYVRLVKAARD